MQEHKISRILHQTKKSSKERGDMGGWLIHVESLALSQMLKETLFKLGHVKAHIRSILTLKSI